PIVSAASSKATVSTLPNVNSLNEAVIYSFFASQSNSPQLDNEDLKQIDPDDLEEMDLNQSNSPQLDNEDLKQIDPDDLEEMDLKSPRDNKNKEATRRPIPIEVSTSNALVSQCDAVGGYDWSFQADEEPTNYALMKYAPSGLSIYLGLDNEVFDCEELHSHESDNSVPNNPENDRYKTGEGYYAVPPPYTRVYLPLNLIWSLMIIPMLVSQ
nr:hypothetical protein [Tanacetum cinerariifolium]